MILNMVSPFPFWALSRTLFSGSLFKGECTSGLAYLKNVKTRILSLLFRYTP